MYQAADARYDGMTYNRCGSSGLRLPAVSLGFWHNFGSTGVYETMRKLCFTDRSREVLRKIWDGL